MRIDRRSTRIVIRDQAGPVWALGLFLLAGAAMAVAMPLGLASNAHLLEPWQRLAIVGVGVFGGAGVLWWLSRHPGTRVELELQQRTLTVVRLGLTGRRARPLAFEAIDSVTFYETRDSDGDPMWRTEMRLVTGEMVPLSELWSHDRDAVAAAAAVVREVVVPRP